MPTVSRFLDIDLLYSDVRERSRLCEALEGNYKKRMHNQLDVSLHTLVHGVLTKEDLAYLKTVFDLVDEDGGGTIDKDEYTSETKG